MTQALKCCVLRSPLLGLPNGLEESFTCLPLQASRRLKFSQCIVLHCCHLGFRDRTQTGGDSCIWVSWAMQLASRNYETQWQPKLCAISEARAKNGKITLSLQSQADLLVNFHYPGSTHFLRLGVQQHLPRCLRFGCFNWVTPVYFFAILFELSIYVLFASKLQNCNPNALV